jgi:hypothetical protein
MASYDSSRIKSLTAQRDEIQRKLDLEYSARESFFAGQRVGSDRQAVSRLAEKVRKLQKVGSDWSSQGKIPGNSLFSVALTNLTVGQLRDMETKIRVLLYGKA